MSVQSRSKTRTQAPLILLASTLALACGDSSGESATTGADDPSDTEATDASGTAASASATSEGTGGATTGATTAGTTSGTTSASTSAGTTSAGTTSAPETETETDATTGDEPVEPDPRQDLLELYAPRIWFPANEEYWPSTVDWALPYHTRFVAGDNNYWIRSSDPLDSPSDVLPWFSGDLETAQVYGFYAEKMDGVLDLVYYVYPPPNTWSFGHIPAVRRFRHF